MKALVTGGAGFIGAYLVRRLSAEGHLVTVLDNLHRPFGGVPEALRALNGVTFVQGDIRDAAVVESATPQVDVVFHLAAQSNVMGAKSDPAYSVTTNVVGTVNVLNAARKNGVPRVVFTSSREAYGEAQYIPVDENHVTNPKNLYGASKVAGEAYCRAFEEPGFDINILRLANVFGPGDMNRVIPLFVEKALASEPLVVYGGSQTLDFVWIDDVVDALMLASSTSLPSALNVGSGVGTSILELAELVVQLAESQSTINVLPARPIEITRFVASTDRMREYGLVPSQILAEHITEVINSERSAQSVGLQT